MSHGEPHAEDKFTGIEADYALLDELNLSPEADGVLRQLGMRLKSGVIIITQNPTRRREWIDALVKNPKCKTIHSTYKDNLDNLPKALIEEIEYRGSVDARFKAIYLDGKYMANAEAAVFTNWDIVNSFPTNAKWFMYGADFGFKNDATTLIEVALYKGEIWIKGLVYGNGMKTHDIYKDFKQVGRSLIIADSSEPRLISELHIKGLNITGIKKYKDHKLEAVRQLQQYKINVFYDSPELIREMEDYEWKKINGEYTDVLQDGNDHYLDALFYATRDKLRINAGKYSYK
jgi:phage terminase large subunit